MLKMLEGDLFEKIVSYSQSPFEENVWNERSYDNDFHIKIL